MDSAVGIGASTMGGIAAIMNGGCISNCTVSGRVVSANSDVGGAAGGIVGQIQGGVIEQCISHVNVSGIRGVGSFVGQCLEGSTIRNSSSTGQAHCTQYHVGGFAGVNSGLIEQCYATGNVSRSYYSYASTSDCAGFVGWNQGAIKACYSTGDVTPSAYMQGAGFCGTNTLGQIESCYSTGTIYVSEMYGNGAIFCSNNGQQSGYVGSPDVYGIIINCFTTGRVVRSDYPDNISDFLRSATFESKTVNCSFNTDSAVNKGCWGGTFGLTTAQMQSQAFVDTLNMVAILSGTSLWQYRPGQYPVPTGIKATSIVPYLAGGVGSEADPFLISNINQLTLLSIVTNKGEDFRGTHFKLTNDIAMNVPFAQWGETMPTKWNAIGHKKTNHTYRFRGIFDGDYHELSNLYIDIYDAGAGLFGFLEEIGRASCRERVYVLV